MSLAERYVSYVMFPLRNELNQHVKNALAVALSMTLNELGTNALKYGELSTERGAVAIRWTSGGRFRLRWQETGGSAVAAPSRRSFGPRMIGRGLAAELRGEVRIDWWPEGRGLHHRRAARRHPRAGHRAPHRHGMTRNSVV
jgi:two-component sensor histidine kinase